MTASAHSKSEGQDSTVTVCQERGLEASAKATKVLSLPTLESNRIDQRSAASKLKPLSSLGVSFATDTHTQRERERDVGIICVKRYADLHWKHEFKVNRRLG